MNSVSVSSESELRLKPLIIKKKYSGKNNHTFLNYSKNGLYL